MIEIIQWNENANVPVSVTKKKDFAALSWKNFVESLLQNSWKHVLSSLKVKTGNVKQYWLKPIPAQSDEWIGPHAEIIYHRPLLMERLLFGTGYFLSDQHVFALSFYRSKIILDCLNHFRPPIVLEGSNLDGSCANRFGQVQIDFLNIYLD